MFPSFLRNFAYNVAITLRALLPLPMQGRLPIVTPVQILLAVTVNIAAIAMSTAWFIWPIGAVNVYGLTNLLSAISLTLGALTLGAVVVGRAGLAGPLVVAVSLAFALGNLASGLHWAFYQDVDSPRIYWINMVIANAPVLVVIMRLFARPRSAAFLRSIPALALLSGTFAVQQFYLPNEWLFDPVYDETTDQRPVVDVEALYQAQPAAMADATAGLRPGTKGKIELFALLGAGHAYQGVFLSEVTQTAALLTDRFDAKDHILQLANSEAEPFALPMANRANLAAGMRALAAKMNGAEDIALIFLTSHGSEDLFSLAFYQAGTADLSAADLKAMLDTSGLRNVVLVISACHSGSFIDDLAAPDRLIITAAAADRTSFGCSDKAEWTWFGDAFVNTSLRKTHDFRKAFVLSQLMIRAWELTSGYQASQPQMSEGAAIGAVLDAWLAQSGSTPG